jgi:hypothetical protein
VVADGLIFQQVVNHVGPTQRAGRGAVHQHDRDTTVSVRLQRKEVVVGGAIRPRPSSASTSRWRSRTARGR